jgi:phage shock protein C
MTRSKSLFARHDTFFGVCEALGQDFGFNANWLRLAVAVGLLVAPIIATAAYLGLGLVVLVSRLLFPSRPTAPVIAPVQPSSERKGDNDAEQIELAAAA